MRSVKKEAHTPGLLFSDALSDAVDEVLAKKGKAYRLTLGYAFQPLRFFNTYKRLPRTGGPAFHDVQFETKQAAPPPGECLFWIGDSPYSVYPEVASLLGAVKESIEWLEKQPSKICERKLDDFGESAFTLCSICSD